MFIERKRLIALSIFLHIMQHAFRKSASLPFRVRDAPVGCWNNTSFWKTGKLFSKNPGPDQRGGGGIPHLARHMGGGVIPSWKKSGGGVGGSPPSNGNGMPAVFAQETDACSFGMSDGRFPAA